MTTLSKEASRILEVLRANTETTSQKADGSVWGSVYLDNARPNDVSPRSFAGYLSALEAAGFYKSQNDNAFGSVLMLVAEQEDEDDLDLGEWEPHPEDPDASKIDAELIRNRRRRDAVTYAAQQIVAGTDPQQIEWSLLNLEQFAPLIASFGDDLYERVIEIIEDGEDAAENARIDAMKRDAHRYEQYLAEYPELDMHREW